MTKFRAGDQIRIKSTEEVGLVFSTKQAPSSYRIGLPSGYAMWASESEMILVSRPSQQRLDRPRKQLEGTMSDKMEWVCPFCEGGDIRMVSEPNGFWQCNDCGSLAKAWAWCDWDKLRWVYRDQQAQLDAAESRVAVVWHEATFGCLPSINVSVWATWDDGRVSRVTRTDAATTDDYGWGSMRMGDRIIAWAYLAEQVAPEPCNEPTDG